MADAELRQLKRIEKELEEIKERTANPKRSFFIGILQGAGAIIGGIFAVALIGWILAVLGIVPGLGDIVAYLRSVVNNVPTRW